MFLIYILSNFLWILFAGLDLLASVELANKTKIAELMVSDLTIIIPNIICSCVAAFVCYYKIKNMILHIDNQFEITRIEHKKIKYLKAKKALLKAEAKVHLSNKVLVTKPIKTKESK